jgi:hypothetical protein
MILPVSVDLQIFFRKALFFKPGFKQRVFAARIMGEA